MQTQPTNPPTDPIILNLRKKTLRYAGYILALIALEWWFSMMYVAAGMNLIATAYNIPSEEWTNIPLLENGIFFGSIPAMLIKIVFLIVAWRVLKIRKGKNGTSPSHPTPTAAPPA